MAITTEWTNTVPMLEAWMGTRLVTDSLSTRVTVRDIDFCFSGFECDYVEIAFGDTNDTDPIRNDKHTFSVILLKLTDTAVYKVLKDGDVVETITDSSFGDYFPKSSFNNVPGQELITQFIIDWRTILDAHGGGNYTIEVDTVIIGTSQTLVSHQFCLWVYSDTAADGTVRIETTQDGDIIGSPFNYTGLDFYRSVRISGKFWNKTPIDVQKNYQSSKRELQQITSSTFYEYVLEIEKIPNFIANLFFKDMFLADNILVTDYNLFNADRYDQLPVNRESTDDVRESNGTTLAGYDVKFSDRDRSIKKQKFT